MECFLCDNLTETRCKPCKRCKEFICFNCQWQCEQCHEYPFCWNCCDYFRVKPWKGQPRNFQTCKCPKCFVSALKRVEEKPIKNLETEKFIKEMNDIIINKDFS